MKFTSHKIDKLEYARYLTASMAYLAKMQRDAAGLIVFDDEVRNFIPPSTRQGQLARLLHAVEKRESRQSHQLTRSRFRMCANSCTAAG